MLKKLNFQKRPFLFTTIILISIALIFLLCTAFFSLFTKTEYSGDAPAKLLEGWEYTVYKAEDVNKVKTSYGIKDITDGQWKKFAIKAQPMKQKGEKGEYLFRVKLPQQMSWENASIYFEEIISEHVEFYIDDEKIFDCDTPVSSGFRQYQMSKNRFLIPLKSDFGGKMLYIKAYGSMSYIGPYREIVVGSHRDLLKIIMKKDADNLVLGVFFGILGFFIIPTIVFLRKQERITLFYLGMFTISLGAFFISMSTGTKLIVYENNNFWWMINIVSNYSIMIFFMLFFERVFLIDSRRSFRWFWKISVLFIVFLCSLHLVNMILKLVPTDLSFWTFEFIAGCNLVLMIIIVLRKAINGSIDARIFTVAFIIFAVVAAVEIAIMISTGKPAYFFKWTLLIFVAALVLILGRRFSEAHNNLLIYSAELEEKNVILSNTLDELKRSKDEVDELNRTLEQRVADRTRELEQAMETIIKTRDQLIQSEKLAALGNLVIGVAHEINTPVGIGVTAASYLDSETKGISNLFTENRMKKSDLQGYLDTCSESSGIILSNLKRAAQLIKSFKMIAVDQSSEEKRRFNVREYIEGVLISLSPELKKTNHSISVNCPDNLEIESYPGVFSQIITNFVMNSIIHAYGDDDKGKMSIEFGIESDSYVFRYSDDGKGIAQNIIEKIFEPFFTTGRSKGGTGLGLNVVYNIVNKRLNGSITCESELGKGTKFIIRFPVDT